MNNLKPIMDEFGLSEIIARALINRGIDTLPKVSAFFNTELSSLHDPYLMKGMDKAVGRILEAVKARERICVYGDYDVDGITSTAVMVRTLRRLGADPIYYIPNRMEEGYGLSMGSIDFIKEHGINLIVTVDCGIRSNDIIDYASSLGMQVIVTDHHECEGELPNAFSIINPHQYECCYPYKGLAGVGVAFKLASSLLERSGYGDFAAELLDLVTLGTIADVVPLLDENRVIVKNGLEKIRHSTNEGIRALLEVCGLSGKELNAYNVAFMLAPRINAAGRIADASDCVELLLTDNPAKAADIAKKLDADNRERQGIENQILNDAVAMLESSVDFEKDRALVLAGEGWHIGVIGIVASRLVDRYYLPAMVMSVDGELSKGSARSIPGFNIFEAMSKYGSLFEKYGGHEMAAGFTIRTDRIEELRESMNKEVARVLGTEKPMPELRVDYKLSPGDINLDTVNKLKLLEPFGIGNPSPLYVYRALRVLSARAVGSDGKHLSLMVYDGVNEIKCIAYNLGNMQKVLSIGKKIDIICSVENNLWNNIESVQLNIKDIRLIK